MFSVEFPFGGFLIDGYALVGKYLNYFMTFKQHRILKKN